MLISTHTELDNITGGYRHTQHIRAIAYPEDGVLKRNVLDVVAGDATWPHIVTRAPIIMYAGGDGMRRLSPTRDPKKYLDIGAPYFPSGSTWQKVNMGAATRTANKITWSTAAADLSIVHAGHYVKLEIPLKSAAAKAVGRIAFPFDLVGLTYKAGVLYDNGKPVMELRAPMVYDAAHPMNTKLIAWDFASVAGQQYLVLTLPSLTDMAQPVVDPTLTLQPDAAAGKDTSLSGHSSYNNTNFGANPALMLGRNDATGYGGPLKVLIAFNISTIPIHATVSAVSLLLTVAAQVLGSGTVQIYDMAAANSGWVEGTKVAAAETGSSTWLWKIASTVAWAGSAGLSTAETDYINTLLASYPWTAPSSGTHTYSLPVSIIAAWQSSNVGLLLKAASPANANYIYYRSSDDTTDITQRPELLVEYTLPITNPITRPCFGRF